MNRLEIIKDIRELYSNHENIDKKKKFLKRITDKYFESDNEKYLFSEWKRKQNNNQGENWAQFVRLAIDFEKIENMFSRIRELLRRYSSSNNYFKASLNHHICQLPDRVIEIESFFELYDEFFQIYKKIMNQINFDHIKKITTDNMVHGRINWNATIKKSKTHIPIYFETRDWKIDFSTPENELMILCVMLLQKIALQLLRTKFIDPLHSHETRIVLQVLNGTRNLLKSFPFQELIHNTIQYKNISKEHEKIKKLENQVKRRFREGLILNKSYKELFFWFQKFKTYNPPNINTQNYTSNFLLESTKDIDTLYEVWLFFEMLHNFQKNAEVKLVLDEYPQFFQFSFNNHMGIVYYEKSFTLGDGYAWAHPHTPDFTVFSKNQIVGIFDAKNYKQTPSEDNSPKNKILAYITNLDSGYGGVFWPKEESSIFEYLKNNAKFHYNLKIVTYSMNPYDSKAFDKISRNFDDVFEELKLRIINIHSAN